MIYLTKKIIVNFSRATVAQHGGNFVEPNNFLHEENLTTNAFMRKKIEL